MTSMKVIKNKAYYKRFQTKKRRRREGKTDFAQRLLLVKQDQNKYNSKKYRLVVRFTNSKCICQIVTANIEGDIVHAQALSTELPKYGVKVGLTNYAAAYTTGLLVARRFLKKLNLDKDFEGLTEVEGQEYHIEDEAEDRRPVKVILDVGLVRTSIGANVFGALKGAVDGGLHIPHNNKRFPGFKKGAGDEDDEYDAEAHSVRIFGAHVAQYMEHLKEEDPEKYNAQFKQYIKNGLTDGEKIEKMYEDAFVAIRAKPEAAPKKVRKNDAKVVGNKTTTAAGKTYARAKQQSLKQRKGKVMQKIASAQYKMAA